MTTAMAWCAQVSAQRYCPRIALEITAASDLVAHPLDDPALTRQLGVLHKKQRAYSPAASSFVAELESFAADWFDAKPATQRIRRRR
ncbi:MAG TPA: hypothetical protein VGK44_12050 [Casimicrobiaceae bacterium]|jgi:hypothetical protein